MLKRVIKTEAPRYMIRTNLACFVKNHLILMHQKRKRREEGENYDERLALPDRKIPDNLELYCLHMHRCVKHMWWFF